MTLKTFVTRRVEDLSIISRMYTLNYDLLLYWALMQEDLEPPMEFDDGFRNPEDGPTDYVTWDSERSYTQTIHYLHGALHLFDAGVELQKYTWCNTGQALIEQIKEAVDSNRFPLFVAEGTAEAKLERIVHSLYLGKSMRGFGQIKNDLFVYGFSFGQSDDHILRLIGRNHVKQMFVSLYGDPDSEANKLIVQRAESIKNRRKKYELEIHYFDAAGARVWG
jgi:hypothetical protein